jgi:hypothetical protein
MYIPHKEMKVSWDSSQTDLTVSLPWVSIDIDINPNDRIWVQEAIENLYDRPSHASVQKFLEPLKEYNVGYYAPQASIPSKLPSSSQSLLDISVISSPHNFITYLGSQFLEELNDLPSQWCWDIEEICEASLIANTLAYDSLSVGSLLIGKMLGSEAQTKNQRIDLPQQLDILRQKNEGNFFNICKILIRQTHYITCKFQEYAPHALKCFPEARQVIEGFIREEVGHDKLMSSSLKVLKCPYPEEVSVLPEIALLMEVFKFASSNFPLAFSCLISFFEGMSYTESDPIADVLLKSSCPEAAKGYQVHFNINKEHQHKDTALHLMQKLPPRNKQEVSVAARTVELAAKLGNIFDISLIKIIEQTKGE